ncbi:MAG TPA: hypothetical protein VL651_00135 [Bacteroidia bacterium]|jgi:hypothetical protein|nr:hypothetical protein [Bacteroidia bacterium]
MHFSGRELIFLGLTPTAAMLLAASYRRLRNDRIVFVLIILCVSLAIWGIYLRSPEFEMKGGNAADSLYSPLIYILTYATLRYLFKKKYGFEPTYYKHSWYDPVEKRDQNWFDIVVLMLPFLLAVFIPAIIHLLMKSQ